MDLGKTIDDNVIFEILKKAMNELGFITGPSDANLNDLITSLAHLNPKYFIGSEGKEWLFTPIEDFNPSAIIKMAEISVNKKKS